MRGVPPIRALVLHAGSAANATFSYQTGWPRALAGDPRFRCRVVNVAQTGTLAKLAAVASIRRGGYDVVLLLHSVFSNGCMLVGRLFDAVRAAGAPKVYFIGNEYKLMPEKMAFADALETRLLISQSADPRVHDMYRRRLGCDVVGIPNTGVDLREFHATTGPDHRPIDLGYRADDQSPYFGHNERRQIADFFERHAQEFGLRVDISLKPGDRFAGAAWSAFLNRCRGQLGTEAGGDYVALDDGHRLRVNAFVEAHPGASFQEVFDACLRGVPPTPIRIISGRNVEAAATRTVQILFEGRYDGYFVPDEHYIALRKDFSNIGDVLAKFNDRDFCRRIADNAYRLAENTFTYDALIGRVHDAVTPLAA